MTTGTEPRVCLGMIARDEAEMLPGFFRAVRGAWDELVVVDTGSRDETVSLVEREGGRVIHHPWRNDFAEARNVGLAAATADWILFLDPDEMVGAGFVEEVRRFVRDPRLGAATVQMRNEYADGHVRISPLLRLFRRDASIQFRHRIHEEVATSVRAYLDRTGRYQGALESEILHLGYTRERAVARGKRERDLTLLGACVDENPDDFYSWFKLLEVCRFWGEADLGRAHATRCLAQLARSGPAALADALYGGELIALAASAFAPGDPGRAGRVMDLWERNLRPAAAFYLRRGELAEEAGHLDRAVAAFQRCLDLRAGAADLQIATVRPLLGLARVAMGRDQLDAAWRFVECAVGLNPTDPEALLAAVAICRTAGGDRMVDELASAYGRKYGDDTPVRHACAQAHVEAVRGSLG